MKRQHRKRMPWAIFSVSFLLFLLLPARHEGEKAPLEERQQAICEADSFDVRKGREYYEKLFGSSLDGLGLEIERARLLPVVVDGEANYCYCFDFEGDRGYAVFDDEKAYRVASEGDCPWLFGENVYYDLEGGFLHYSDETGSFRRIDEATGEDTGEALCEEFLTGSSAEDGQITAAQLPGYVASVHPSWSLAATVVMGNYVKRSQFTNSFYQQLIVYSSGRVSLSSEGNCAPNAMSSYLYNLPTATAPSGSSYHYCPDLNNGKSVTSRYAYFSSHLDTFSDELSDNVYYLDDNGNYLSSGTSSTSVHWTLRSQSSNTWTSSDDLYWQVRAESIERGFDPRDGFYMVDNGEAVMETVLSSYYGYDVDIYRTELASNVAPNIVFGIPVVVSARGSSTYGSHAMSIYGYKRYEYQTTINGSSVTQSAYIWLVDDGWEPHGSSEQRWYDPNRGTTNRYFCTDRNSLTWTGC